VKQGDAAVNRKTCFWPLALVAILTGSSALSAAAPQNATTDAAVSSLPAAPTGVTATAGDSQITLSWNLSDAANSYTVYRRAESGIDAVVVAADLTVSTFTDTDLSNGTTYYYWVQASRDGATSALSTRASESPQPLQPSRSAATALIPIGGTLVSAKTQPAPARAPQSATTPALAAAPSSVPALSSKPEPPPPPAASSLSAPANAAPASDNATVAADVKDVAVTMTAPPPAPVEQRGPVTIDDAGGAPPAPREAAASPPPPPSTPRDLRAAAADRSVMLTWTLVSGAMVYNIYRGTVPNGEVRVVVLSGPSAPPFVDFALTNGVTYYYKITAVNANGESSRSAEVSVSPVGPPPPPDPATVAAFRFLRQATWGPKPGDVEAVKSLGADAYLANVMSAPASTYPDTLFTQPIEMAQERFMDLALTGGDQLRQRVAWALHKIMVVSAVEVSSASGIVTYHRLFLNGAFGNFRDLMRDITLNPAMGRYLNMLNNRSQAVTGALPNENYARELMQLFTVGIPTLDHNGNPVFQLSRGSATTYSEQDVKELARIFTGWTFGDGNPATVPNNLGSENYKVPMEAVARYHDTGVKTFLNQTFSAGQTARQDLDQALDLLFNNPNVGPFISRQLIQQLVTSNPSPAYVGAVAAVFDDNGGGVRGDLAAVVRAILMHPEAGTASLNSGKLSEPVLFVVSALRALNATVTDQPFMSDKAEAMGQKVLFPGSVFSYFSPGYRVRDTSGAGGAPLGGPEFQILTSVTALERANFVGDLLAGRYGTDVTIDYTPFTSRAANAQALVDYCSLLLMGGQMSADERLEIVNAVTASRMDNPTERVRTALYLTLTSAEFQVDH
jgi:uncharacterized protein (DUF1800 family)